MKIKSQDSKTQQHFFFLARLIVETGKGGVVLEGRMGGTGVLRMPDLQQTAYIREIASTGEASVSKGIPK